MSKYKIVSLKNNFCTDVIVFKWRLTFICNYNCPYCIQSEAGLKKSYNGEKLKEEQIAREKTATKLDKFLTKINPKGKKIDLAIIGGEVTLFNLISILEKITYKNIYKVSFTTNGSKPLDYFYELAEYLHSRDIQLAIYFSYHDTQTTFSEYIHKAVELNKIADEFSCEYISRTDNQDNVLKLIETLEEKGIDYKIEFDKTKRAYLARMSGKLIAKSNFSNRNRARYDAILENEEGKTLEKKYDCLCDVFNDAENGSVVHKKVILSKGFYCTENYSYFYLLDNEKIVGATKDNPSCLTKTDIDVFEPLEKPIKCVQSACSGCGFMSLYKELPSDFE